MLAKLYFKNKFFIWIGVCIVAFILSFSYEQLFVWSKGLLLLILILTLVDYVILVLVGDKIRITRSVFDKLSMGDSQKIKYLIENKLPFQVDLDIYDEFPQQLQERKFYKSLKIEPLKDQMYDHLGLVERKLTIDTERDVAVVPSIIQMKKAELQVFSKTATLAGIRRIRQVGENDEFEHIRSYSQGDNIKSINWKATSRKNQLMVNQYQNSRSQMIYSIIDKGRSMKMPFRGLTLLDHSINAALAFSNIVLKKHDKAGLITFSNKIGNIVKAEANTSQLEKIATTLYHQKTGFLESNFELLFFTLRKHLSRRSILFFYTNFETPYDLERNLPYLKSLNKKHLLVVISFINTELIQSSEMLCKTKSDIYFKTFAQKTLIEKEKIMNILRVQGIQTILTKPEDLNINVINKYLEIKAKRMK